MRGGDGFRVPPAVSRKARAVSAKPTTRTVFGKGRGGKVQAEALKQATEKKTLASVFSSPPDLAAKSETPTAARDPMNEGENEMSGLRQVEFHKLEHSQHKCSPPSKSTSTSFAEGARI
ncbi:hypothetical protein [Sinorhizobium meliloti]|uniref:hypothetical protein n=1 Tax=Rhizobium meliloti TaxID=382 RepID=UPI001F1A9107|nr:hypothetical protein [Sinorhizobium meliloti]